jgi:hypothetical protein
MPIRPIETSVLRFASIRLILSDMSSATRHTQTLSIGSPSGLLLLYLLR